MSDRSTGQLIQQPCLSCTGRGQNMCPVCGGAGASFLSKTRFGVGGRMEFYQERVACRQCFGTGRVTCLFCRGVGSILVSR